MHKIRVEIEVSDEDIANIVNEASKGMTYWAGNMKLEGLAIGEYFTFGDALADGKRVRIYDDQEEKWHILTLKKLLVGIKLMGKYDFYEYDMYDCERVVQYALFGKQVYA